MGFLCGSGLILWLVFKNLKWSVTSSASVRRSSNQLLLDVPRAQLRTRGDQAFSWKSCPDPWKLKSLRTRRFSDFQFKLSKTTRILLWCITPLFIYIFTPVCSLLFGSAQPVEHRSTEAAFRCATGSRQNPKGPESFHGPFHEAEEQLERMNV